MVLSESESEGVTLWGKPLYVNVCPDGWVVRCGGRYVWNTLEEAEEAAKNSTLRLETIRIQ